MSRKCKNNRNTMFGSNIEYFNGNTWNKISEYNKGDKVLTFFEDGHVELLTPIKYIKKKTKGLNIFKYGNILDLKISDQALFIGEYRSTNNKEGEKRLITKFTFDRALEVDFNIFFHAKLFKSFLYKSNTNSMLTENKLRLMILSILFGNTNNKNECCIKYNLEIINRVKRILNECCIKYKFKNNEIVFKLPRNKKLFLENPLLFSNIELQTIVDEIDNYFPKSKISPMDLDSLDFIQMVYSLYGKGANIKNKNVIKLKSGTVIFNNKLIKIEHSKDKEQYSFSTKSGYIVIRNNGNIMIMGDYKN